MKMTESISLFVTVAALLGIAGQGGSARAAAIPVTAAGVSATSNNTNWVTNGLATLNGGTSGVDWTVSGERQNADWTYISGGSQSNLGNAPSPRLEWPSAASERAFGYTFSATQLGVGSAMQAGVQAAGGVLVISEVAPAVGDYTLNGVTQRATVVGQVLQWTSPASALVAGDTMTFSSTAVIGANTVHSGPIGFSAVPEPGSLALLAAAALLPLGRRRRA